MDRGTRRRSLVSLRYPRRFERLSIVAHLVLGWQGRFLLSSLFAAGATAIWSRCMPFGTIFVRIYKTLRVTPAMAAGIADPLWSMECVVALIDARSCRGHDNK